LVTAYVGRNCLLKHLIKEKWKEGENEEEGVSIYWMTLRKRKDTKNGKRKY
jgi:hypothetical protein